MTVKPSSPKSSWFPKEKTSQLDKYFIGKLCTLIVLGFLGNYCNVPLFFSVSFTFGSIATLFIAYIYGTFWGVIATFIAAVYTVWLWGHPYALISFLLEVVFVRWWINKRQQSLVLADIIYWSLIGMPLGWIAFYHIMKIPMYPSLMVVFKQSVNGIFNALIADLLIAYTPIVKLVSVDRIPKFSFRQTLSIVLVAFVFFPSLTLIVFNNQQAFTKIQTNTPSILKAVSANVATGIQRWQQQDYLILEQLAKLAIQSNFSPSTALQQGTQLLQKSLLHSRRVAISDFSGDTIAAFPDPQFKPSTYHTETKLSDQPSLLHLFEKTKLPATVIEQVPIVVGNRVRGHVSNEISLDAIGQLLQLSKTPLDIKITLLDNQKRVVSTTRSDLSTNSVFDHLENKLSRKIMEQMYQWLPPGNMPAVERQRRSFYVYTVPIGNYLSWQLVAEVPVALQLEGLQILFIQGFGVIWLIAIAALILATLISQKIVQPIVQLATVTTNFPNKLFERSRITFPKSQVLELRMLIDNSKEMAQILKQQFQDIKTANETLEQKIIERTQELSVKNQELVNEIAERHRVAEALMQSKEQLRQQAATLEKAFKDLQQTQTHLIQTEKMSSLGQLVAGVAHEINNPVNFIHANLLHAQEYTEDILKLLNLYQQYYPNPSYEIEAELDNIDLEFLQEDLPKLLNSMQTGTNRIRDIVRSLRIFSRLDEAEMKEVDIHDGIESALMILDYRLKPRADRPEITVIKEYGVFPLVECYPGQLNQVFMNIIINAIDALEESFIKSHSSLEDNQEQKTKPTIHIQTTVIDNNYIKISIKDNGIGIPGHIRCLLFDPFFTTKPVGKGTGMGLSISHQIITEKHGGRLVCHSELGCGAEFTIEIPTRQQ
ncbi:ATP-binding protein [Scytonema sp. NUACC26]|uniref:ATP-binding protein n=1 Tax=Scytonema sp. NUACC26 TaxID=3140176 RepID=UPI0034DBA622